MLVSFHSVSFIKFFREIYKLSIELYIFLLGFFPLDAHDFLNWLSDVKLYNIFSKFASFDLSVVKKVLDDESHDIGWWLLNFETLIQLF